MSNLLLRRAGAHLEGIAVVLLHQEHWGPRDIRQVSVSTLSVLAVATHASTATHAVETHLVRGGGGPAAVPRSGAGATGRITNVYSNVDVLSLEDVVQWEECRFLDTPVSQSDRQTRQIHRMQCNGL